MTLQPNLAAAWWHGQQENKGGMARLRRCGTVMQAMQQPETIGLFHKCGGVTSFDLVDAGLIAALLSHIKTDDKKNASVAKRIGPVSPDAPETALVKRFRFERIMSAETHDERLTAFRRLITMCGDTVNISDLVRSLLRWNDSTKTRWIFDYWSGQPAGSQSAPAWISPNGQTSTNNVGLSK